jgi:hypothetical protein
MIRFVILLVGAFASLPAFGNFIIRSPATNANFGFSGPFVLPFGHTIRYQQVYGASDFRVLQSGGGLITEITFLPNPDALIGFWITNIQLNLSTTPQSPDALSTVFAGNVGADDTVVWGPGLFPFGDTTGTGFKFRLDRPFFYDPAAGNLLLDVRNFSGGNQGGFYLGDLQAAYYNGDSTSLLSGRIDAPTGTALTWGLITYFTVTPIPEPASTILLLTGGLCLAWQWQRRRCVRRPQRAPNNVLAPPAGNRSTMSRRLPPYRCRGFRPHQAVNYPSGCTAANALELRRPKRPEADIPSVSDCGTPESSYGEYCWGGTGNLPVPAGYQPAAALGGKLPPKNGLVARSTDS